MKSFIEVTQKDVGLTLINVNAILAVYSNGVGSVINFRIKGKDTSIYKAITIKVKESYEEVKELIKQSQED